MKRFVLAVGTALLVSCASAPRPQIMSEVDTVRESTAADEAKSLAPQAFAHAEKLRRRAHAAHEDDDLAGAQILSEHALAAYTHAFVLARLAKAEMRLANAQQELSKAKDRLSQLDQQHSRVSAEAEDLEMRVRVARDALPLVPNVPTSPEREQARREAARALATQGRLLCLSAQLLDPQAQAPGSDLKKLDALDAALAKKPETAPIDEAISLRSSCLRHLTKMRRPETSKAPTRGLADALLESLSKKEDLFPFRDDRGVVVVLREPFGAGTTLKQPAKSRIAELGAVAKRHPSFPVLVVVHSAHGNPSKADEARGTALVEALKQAGATTARASAVGDANPVVPGRSKRNERVEIVFVAPAQ